MHTKALWSQMQWFFSPLWLCQYSSVSLAIGLTEEHLADDQTIWFLICCLFLIYYAVVGAHDLLVLDISRHFLMMNKLFL